MQRSCQSNNAIFEYTYMSHCLWLSFFCLITLRWRVKSYRSLWSAFSGFVLPSFIITSSTGIDLARLADLPLDVLDESRRVAGRLVVLQTTHEELRESRKIANRRKALLRVISSSVPSSCDLIYLGYCTTLYLWAPLPSRLGYVFILFEIWLLFIIW